MLTPPRPIPTWLGCSARLTREALVASSVELRYEHSFCVVQLAADRLNQFGPCCWAQTTIGFALLLPGAASVLLLPPALLRCSSCQPEPSASTNSIRLRNRLSAICEEWTTSMRWISATSFSSICDGGKQPHGA